MRGLTIILESGAPSRIRLAHEMALVQRVLSGAATLFITGDAAVTLITPDLMRDEVLESGAKFIICQAVLSDKELSMAQLDARMVAGGLVSVMQGLGDDRLVVI